MTESNDVETLRTRVHELMPQARSDLAEMDAADLVVDASGVGERRVPFWIDTDGRVHLTGPRR